MVFNVKKIFVAVICALFVIGFSVISKVSADVNPFAPDASNSFIKTVSGDHDGGHGDEGKSDGDGKCGGDHDHDSDDKDSDDEDSDDEGGEHKCGGEGKCAEGKCGG